MTHLASVDVRSMLDGHDTVLFDFFGTLVNYEPDRAQLHYPRSHQLLETWGHGLAHSAFLTHWDAASTALECETSDTHVEFTMLDAAAAFAEATAMELSEEQCRALASTFVLEWAQHIRPIEGVADMIHRLGTSRRIGVVSNTHDPHMVPSMLDTMGIAGTVELVLLSVNHGYRKPHPSIYQAALDHLGCDASTVAFVGDSYEADFLGPQSIGMTGYLIDPLSLHKVPGGQRLTSVLDIEGTR